VTTCIKTGQIHNHATDSSSEFEITHGLNFVLTHNADIEWKKFNINLMQHLSSLANGNEELLRNLYNESFLEDNHWEWLKKAVTCKGNEYEWFYVATDGDIQGICIFYHPKKSRLDQEDIFYIEYLATAPWNRRNKLSPLIYKGIGTILLKESLTYSINHLGYRPGFSLHSLPKAITYYSKIGMQDFGPDPEYYNLNYFEMEQKKSEGFANG